MGKAAIEKIVIVVLTTLFSFGLTVVFARGQLLNKKADYEYVDKRDKLVLEEVDKAEARNQKEHDLLRQQYQDDAKDIKEALKEIREDIRYIKRNDR